MQDLDSIPNRVDKLKRFMLNFIEGRRSVPGGCRLLNTAIDADDGNPVLRKRARKALHQWQDLLSEIVTAGIKRKEIRNGVNPKKVVRLIVGSLEGALMIRQLERDREALLDAQSHLHHHLHPQVRLSAPDTNSPPPQLPTTPPHH